MSLKTLVPSYYSRFSSILRNVGGGTRVLNLGCGDGHYNVFLSERFKSASAYRRVELCHLRLYTTRQLEALFREVGLVPKKRLYLLHLFGGIFENSYVMNFLQPIGKSDPKNLDVDARKETHKTRDPSKITYTKPPESLRRIRDVLMGIDNALFGRSTKSLGIFVMFEKDQR